MEAIRDLEQLFRLAERSCDKGRSSIDFEPNFAAVPDHIKVSNASRPQIEKFFLGKLAERPVAWELLAFCMHELRWSAVRQEALRLSRLLEDPRSRRVYELILESFSDDWDGRDEYSYEFNSARNPRG